MKWRMNHKNYESTDSETNADNDVEPFRSFRGLLKKPIVDEAWLQKTVDDREKMKDLQQRWDETKPVTV